MSNQIACKASVKAIITGLPEYKDEGWQMLWGPFKSPDRTFFYLGRTDWDDDRTRWVTNRSRDEEFRIKVVLNLKRRRKTGEEVEAEAMRIYELVEDAIHATKNLNIPNVISSACVPDHVDTFPVDDEIECQLTFNVWVKARV